VYVIVPSARGWDLSTFKESSFGAISHAMATVGSAVDRATEQQSNRATEQQSNRASQ
jgi:hypothetical protein